jgi:predicted amidohydrolase YtcJ
MERCGWFIDVAVNNSADLIVLDKNYIAVAEDGIRTLTSVLTLA